MNEEQNKPMDNAAPTMSGTPPLQAVPVTPAMPVIPATPTASKPRAPKPKVEVDVKQLKADLKTAQEAVVQLGMDLEDQRNKNAILHQSNNQLKAQLNEMESKQGHLVNCMLDKFKMLGNDLIVLANMK